MITLHQFAAIDGVNLSPFCHKVEVYCQLAKVPYQIKATMPNKAPKGKLPFITNRQTTVADSGLIIDYLMETHGDPLNSALTAEQKSLGHLIRRTCEESLNFVIMYTFWMDDAFWPSFKTMVFGNLPPVIRSIVPVIVQKSVKKSLNAQGYGRHSQDEVYALGRADIDALAILLQKTSFAVGETPTSYDATLYAFLVKIMRSEMKTPLQEAALKHSQLTAYLSRMDNLLGVK